MKLAIVGSRTFNDYGLLGETIWQHFSICKDKLEIVSGGAKGADSFGADFAENWNLRCTVYPPEWDKYGKPAGFIRNQTIVDNCDMVLAFWDGRSKGTQDTINKAKKAKKPTFIVYF
ncbi:hypothetical protein LCGC14_0404490 [marine sediment metagenome]|uniref:YspA cpYpsA-related SLOG domain-containing protein n=1 Tax=marine sediment metagenome TaxID=412755 RepID=A0A0F9SW27_9ZZZZ